MKHNIVKIAWTWEDLASNLGVEALITGGIAGIAALKGGAVGALSTISIGTGPIGLVLGSVLTAAGFAYAIYEGTQMADDNIQDLLKRLDVIEPNDKVAHIVQEWKNELTQISGALREMRLGKTQAEQAEIYGEQVNNLQVAFNVLENIYKEWVQVVKNNLEDPFYEADPRQFDYALRTTISAVTQRLIDIRAKVQQATTQRLKELGAGGADYLSIATEIINLHNQIINIYGRPPEYETDDERASFALANGIVRGKISVRDPKQFELLAKLRDDLKNGVAQLTRRSSIKKHISKRAIKFPSPGGTQKKPIQEKEKKVEQPAQQPNKDVETLQRYINHIVVAGRLNMQFVEETGKYDQPTANALVGILKQFPDLENIMRKYGFPVDYASNVEFMNKYPRFINIAMQIFAAVVQQIQSVSASQQKQPACNENKEDPNDKEILICLQSKFIDSAGEKVNLYTYMKNRGFAEDTMVKLIRRLFGKSKSKDWDIKRIIGAVGGRYTF